MSKHTDVTSKRKNTVTGVGRRGAVAKFELHPCVIARHAKGKSVCDIESPSGLEVRVPRDTRYSTFSDG